MTNIIQFPTPEERNPLEANAFCIACGHIWVTDNPTSVMHFECPQCNAPEGRHILHWPAGELVWGCDCGNNLFFLTSDGLCNCPNCGQYFHPTDIL